MIIRFKKLKNPKKTFYHVSGGLKNNNLHQ